MNGPLALAVFTNTTCLDRSFFSSGSKSAGVMSGPGRLNFATLPSNVPCPISTMKTTSSSPAVASLSNALTISSSVDWPVTRFASFSGFSAR